MVAVCSALVVSVAGLVTSVSGTADRVAAQVAGTADLEVAPAFSGGTVPDDVVDDVAALPGVAAAAPTVQSAVTVDATRALLVAGDARALPFLPPGLADAYAETAGTPPAEAGGEDTGAGPAVLVSVALADDAGLAAGDTVAVRGLTGVTDARVAGVLPEEVAGATVVADLTTGERLRGGGDGPDRLLLALDGDAAGAGGSERAVARRVDEVLAGRAVALDPARRGDAAAETLQPLLRPLLLLSGLTVTVAAVLVFNVVSLAVAERRRYLAIQCALGARRRRLWLGLVGEAALLGAVGGVIGAAVGRPLTAALIDQVPPALASVAVPTSIATDVRWWVLLGGVGVGVAAAAMAAAAAGLPVVRLSPLEAMGPRDVVGEPAGPVRPLAVAVGAVAVIAGVVIVAVAPATLQLLAALVILNGVVALVWALRVPIARVVAAAARQPGPERRHRSRFAAAGRRRRLDRRPPGQRVRHRPRRLRVTGRRRPLRVRSAVRRGRHRPAAAGRPGGRGAAAGRRDVRRSLPLRHRADRRAGHPGPGPRPRVGGSRPRGGLAPCPDRRRGRHRGRRHPGPRRPARPRRGRHVRPARRHGSGGGRSRRRRGRLRMGGRRPGGHVRRRRRLGRH